MAPTADYVTCGHCGTTEKGEAPPTWSMESSERGVRFVCDACTRTNLRSIEGKLDAEWW